MKPKKDLNMKKLFRRNQVIITALAVMIAAAGYLNYAGKQELAAGSQVYEAGILEISDEDVLAENQASEYYGETLAEIDSLDADILDEEAQEAAMAEEAEVMEEAGTAELDGAVAETVKEAEGQSLMEAENSWRLQRERKQKVQAQGKTGNLRRPVWIIQEKQY